MHQIVLSKAPAKGGFELVIVVLAVDLEEEIE